MRIARFIRQPIHRKILFLEAFIRLCHAWFIVRKTGFAKRAPRLGTRYAGDWSGGHPRNLDKIEDVRWAIDRASALGGDKFTCLMIALAGKEMLRRFDIPNALVLGAMKSADPDNPEMLAHAWLRSGSMIVLGERGMQGYRAIVSYVDEPTEKTEIASRQTARP